MDGEWIVECLVHIQSEVDTVIQASTKCFDDDRVLARRSASTSPTPS